MKREKELENLILEHKSLYYSGNPKITDDEFDELEDELKKINPDNYVLSLVGTKITKGKKIKHSEKMLSLEKTYTKDELLKWIKEREVVSMDKIDGVSCSLVYEEGKLKLGKTRGNGEFGENISEKVFWIENIPKSIKDKKNFEVRGELFCTKSSFKKISEEMLSLGLDQPTSQRNIVAGLISRKDHIQLCKNLSFYAFDIISNDFDISTEIDKFKILSKNNFSTPEVIHHINDKKIDKVISSSESFIKNGDYLIDGIVFSFNDLSLHEELGSTSHHPKYKIAFKFKGSSKSTKINEILWQVSRNGVLTPVADVEEVNLSGANITRVTLHNLGVVRDNNLKVGDTIEIIRSGEVIPKFLNVLKSSKGNYKIPKKPCEYCEKPPVVDDIRLRCGNKICPIRDREVVLNFIQKIGIDDISSKRLNEMMSNDLIKTISDLYLLKKEDLLSLDKVKDKLADKLLNNINESKSVSLPVFLSSLGISGGAINKCEKVVDAGFNTIEKVLSMKVEELSAVEGFAEKSATDFVSSLKQSSKEIKKLLSFGFSFDTNSEEKSGKLDGLLFCITGTLSMKRSEIEKMVKENGGKVSSSVSNKTNYLITNDKESNSSKFQKAKKLNIKIINEGSFLKLL